MVYQALGPLLHSEGPRVFHAIPVSESGASDCDLIALWFGRTIGRPRASPMESMNKADQQRFLPVSGNVLPRFAGIPTFMRLPHIGIDEAKSAGVEIGLIGVPWDGGTTNRPG